MVCLACHDVQSQSAGPEREVRFGNQLRPSYVRIHGTMYRNIFAASDSDPVRFLVVAPAEHETVAAKHALNLRLLRRLERLFVPNNEFMQQISQLQRYITSALDAALRLRWDEGLNEVAAVVQQRPDGIAQPRAVCFRLNRTADPEYLHPLHCLYEPLSYPLFYPQGGREWSTDATASNGQHVTQMWWYRQQVLRLPHLHLCGRLLNEWFIDMYCRMEDERLSLVRREQDKPIATRKYLCEALANEDIPTPA